MKRILSILTVVCLVVAMAVPVFADSIDVPPVKDVWDSSTYPYAVVALNDNGELWLTVCTEPFTVEGSDQVSSTGAYKTFKLNTNNVWVSQTTSNGTVSAGWLDNVRYTTHDLYNIYGGIDINATPDFFNPPPPLAEVIQGVAEETIQEKTLPEMAGTMRILALCGVGLIALLVVLKLFGKRSLIYRN